MNKKVNKKTIIYIVIAVGLCIGTILYLLADRYLIEHAEAQVKNSQTLKSSTEQYTADENSYISDSKSIKITKKTKGSGNNKVTYYVADVQVKDATELTAQLAKNTFGRNIIDYTSTIAENNDAIFAINGDYYGFRSDGVVIRNGVLYRNEPARIGLALYKDGRMEIYDETEIPAEQLLADGVWSTYSFGPALVDNGEIVEGIDSIEVDTNFGNHSIQGKHPRTGIGMIDNNHYVFIVVDGRSKGYSRGMTLTELAQVFKELGCKVAYNFDGGGSSTMYFMGKVVNNPLGKNQERGVSDILCLN